MISSLMAGLLRVLCGRTVRNAPADLTAGGVVYYSNHSSHLDFLALWAAFPRHWRSRLSPVAARDYWSAGPIRRYLARRVFHAILVDRHRSKFSRDALTPLLDALDAGRSLILFPEGTRSADGELHDFKAGLFHIAHRRPTTRFVPVYLENLNRILPKGELLAVPMLGALDFGEPLTLAEGEERESFLARARDALLAAGDYHAE